MAVEMREHQGSTSTRRSEYGRLNSITGICGHVVALCPIKKVVL